MSHFGLPRLLIILSAAAAAVVLIGSSKSQQVFTQSYSDWISEEICETETFNATCQRNEIIFLTHAVYGRMRIGKCVKLDYGHLGCSANVLGLADALCSGRQHCEIRVPEASFTKHLKCPDDLKPYLEITYACVQVVTPPVENCRLTGLQGAIVPLAKTGFIASLITEQTYCGGQTHPWIIQAKTGQKINVVLYDFNAYGRSANAVDKVNRPQYCNIYAIIRESRSAQAQNFTVCGTDAREKTVYLSKTSSIEITIISQTTIDIKLGTFSVQNHFLLKYEVMGCVNYVHALNSWFKRDGDTLTVHCNYSSDFYLLTCINGEWVGQLGNCSHRALFVKSDVDISRVDDTYDQLNEIDYLPYGLSILIVLAIALLIGLSVLALGLLFLKRHITFSLSSSAPDTPISHHSETVAQLPQYSVPRRSLSSSWIHRSSDRAKAGMVYDQLPRHQTFCRGQSCATLYGPLRCQATNLCDCTVYTARSEVNGDQNEDQHQNQNQTTNGWQRVPTSPPPLPHPPVDFASNRYDETPRDDDALTSRSFLARSDPLLSQQTRQLRMQTSNDAFDI